MLADPQIPQYALSPPPMRRCRTEHRSKEMCQDVRVFACLLACTISHKRRVALPLRDTRTRAIAVK